MNFCSLLRCNDSSCGAVRLMSTERPAETCPVTCRNVSCDLHMELRVLRCWRFFLPLFKAVDRTNYSIEAITLLSLYEFLFTPQMQWQLLWSRTVNVYGKAGRNVSCDLHMEDINCECKGAIGILGSNISDETVGRIGRSIGELMKITTQYDREHGVPRVYEKHSKRSTAKNLDRLFKQLHDESKVFCYRKGWQHLLFKKFSWKVKAAALKWMERLQKHVMPM